MSRPVPPGRFDRYLRVVFGALALYLVVVGPLNALIDPHDTFPALHMPSFERHRLWASRITKANAATAGGAGQIAVLGSSRAALAFRPRGDSLRDPQLLNLAVQQTSLRELQSIADVLFLHNRPRELLIGIEFDYFNYDFIPDEFLKSRFNPALAASEVLFEQLLGEYTLEKSLQTVRATFSSTPEPEQLLSRRKKFALLVGDTVRLAIDLPPPAHYAKEQLARLRHVVELAARHETRVSVVMMPVHATILIAYDKLGLWPRFETWKRDVLAALADTPATIWDFNQLAAEQTEAIPDERAADQEMQWYTDASHCSPRYGQRILDRVLSREGTARDGTPPRSAGVVPDDAFASVLRPETLEAHLTQIRARERSLLTSAPAFVRFVDDVIEHDRNQRQRDR